jgi:hypothetical protein
MEILIRGKGLADELRADCFAVANDQASIRLVVRRVKRMAVWISFFMSVPRPNAKTL